MMTGFPLQAGGEKEQDRDQEVFIFKSCPPDNWIIDKPNLSDQSRGYQFKRQVAGGLEPAAPAYVVQSERKTGDPVPFPAESKV